MDAGREARALAGTAFEDSEVAPLGWLLPPVAGAVAEWAVLGLLDAVVACLWRVARSLADTQRACRVLMRGDLLLRWATARDAGWMAEEDKRRWFDDRVLYLRMAGSNGYLDEVSERVAGLPGAPPSSDSEER